MKNLINDSLVVIGKIRSELTRIESCPKMAEDGAPDGIIVVMPQYASALQGIETGAQLLVLTWLHLADRDIQLVHPKGDPDNPLTGVFMTRSPDRPNPIGVHSVRVLGIDGLNLLVSAIEVLDQTPVIDIKTVHGRPLTAVHVDCGVCR